MEKIPRIGRSKFSEKIRSEWIQRCVNNVSRRGRISAQFRQRLENEWTPLIEFISKNHELDVQLRDNYISVYYDGGEIIKITPKSLDIDMRYFEKYANSEKQQFLERCSQNIAFKKSAKEKLLTVLIEENDIGGYFKQAKELISEWVERHKRYERKKLHEIACSNRELSPHNNLVVIDIEFAVDWYKPYNNSQGKGGKRKVPKFDIIAVDQSGQLYAIILQDNLRTNGDRTKQSLNAYKQDFYLTIGDDTPLNDFAQEMNEVLKMKQELGLLPKSLIIDTDALPRFAVAFSIGTKPKRYDGITVNIVNSNDKLYLNLQNENN